MNGLSVLRRVLVGKSLRRTFIRAAVITAVCVVLFKFILLPVRIRGTSMSPTCRDGSFNFIFALRYRLREPRRGDIVAIRMAGKRIMLFKRILGLPGERVAFKDGALIVDGRRVPEPYVKRPSSWNMPEVAVSRDEYFVAGDNRSMPIETHTHGRVERNRIVGGPLF